MNLPISVIMMTKNEAINIVRTLPPLLDNFDDVHVLDSNSTDNTQEIAKTMGAHVTNFTWNGHYPKKKQWGVENLPLKHSWILQVDADERMTDAFITDLKNTTLSKDGYFISSRMIWNGRLLKHGMKNNKLCLYKKSMFKYPAVDDLKSPGGWEVEGHYQPCPVHKNASIGQIQTPILHTDNSTNWLIRHQKYALWERDMTINKSWPNDPVFFRNILKKTIKNKTSWPFIMFFYCYVLKGGFMDRAYGFDYAKHRMIYAQMIIRVLKDKRKDSYKIKVSQQS